MTSFASLLVLPAARWRAARAARGAVAGLGVGARGGRLARGVGRARAERSGSSGGGSRRRDCPDGARSFRVAGRGATGWFVVVFDPPAATPSPCACARASSDTVLVAARPLAAGARLARRRPAARSRACAGAVRPPPVASAPGAGVGGAPRARGRRGAGAARGGSAAAGRGGRAGAARVEPGRGPGVAWSASRSTARARVSRCGPGWRAGPTRWSGPPRPRARPCSRTGRVPMRTSLAVLLVAASRRSRAGARRRPPDAAAAAPDSTAAAPPARPPGRLSWLSDRLPLRVGDLLTVVVDEATAASEHVSKVATGDHSLARRPEREHRRRRGASAPRSPSARASRAAPATWARPAGSGDLTAVLTVRSPRSRATALARIEGAQEGHRGRPGAGRSRSRAWSAPQDVSRRNSRALQPDRERGDHLQGQEDRPEHGHRRPLPRDAVAMSARPRRRSRARAAPRARAGRAARGRAAASAISRCTPATCRAGSWATASWSVSTARGDRSFGAVDRARRRPCARWSTCCAGSRSRCPAEQLRHARRRGGAGDGRGLAVPARRRPLRGPGLRARRRDLAARRRAVDHAARHRPGASRRWRPRRARCWCPPPGARAHAPWSAGATRGASRRAACSRWIRRATPMSVAAACCAVRTSPPRAASPTRSTRPSGRTRRRPRTPGGDADAAAAAAPRAGTPSSPPSTPSW